MIQFAKNDDSKKKPTRQEILLVQLEDCKQKIAAGVREALENVTEIGLEASKLNYVLREMKEILEEK